MSRFSKMGAALAIEGRTARYTLVEVEGAPVLVLRPASTENKLWVNAILRDGAAAGARSTRPSIENVEKSHALVRRVFPACIVAGWEGVVDNDGAPVPFSAGAARELFDALPGYMLEGIAAFAADPMNFLPAGRGAGIDTETAAGNL